jgi:hypothetical protein
MPRRTSFRAIIAGQEAHGAAAFASARASSKSVPNSNRSRPAGRRVEHARQHSAVRVALLTIGAQLVGARGGFGVEHAERDPTPLNG